jgi:hypothetical protein
MRREKKKEEKDIPEHGGEEKELKREEGVLIFLHMGKMKKKRGPSVVKLGILGFFIEAYYQWFYRRIIKY